MRTRQIMIPLQDLAAMGSGFLVAQYLRGRGINPAGDVRRFVENGNMIYTEVLEDEDENNNQIFTK